MSQKQPEPPSKIMMLGPMAIVLVVYSFVFFAPQQSKLRSAQARFDTLSADHHSTEHEVTDVRIESARTQKEIRDLTDQLHDLQHAQEDLVADRNEMLHQLESHALPAATMQRVTQLMKTHRLQVLESQPDSNAANEVERALKSLRGLLQEETSNHSHHSANHTHGHEHADHSRHEHHTATSPRHTHFTREVYQLRVRGRFHDLQAALESMAAEMEDVLPLSLQMEPMELDSTEVRQSERIWTLAIMV